MRKIPGWLRSVILSVLVVAVFIGYGTWLFSSFVYHWLVPMAATLALSALLLIWWPLLHPLRPLWRAGCVALCVLTGVLILTLVSSGWPELQLYDGPGAFTEDYPLAMLLIPMGLGALLLFVPLSLLVAPSTNQP